MAKDYDVFEEGKEVELKYNSIKFGKVGDFFEGTLTDNSKKTPNQLSQKHEVQTIFVFKGRRGSLHLINDKEVDKNATTINPGEEWSFITGKQPMLKMLKDAKIGQVIGLKFTEERPAKVKGYNKTKIVKVVLGKMDDEYVAAQEADMNIDFE